MFQFNLLAQEPPRSLIAENWTTPMLWLLGLPMLGLIVAWVILGILRRQSDAVVNPVMVDHLSSRCKAWLLMYAILLASFLLDRVAAIVLFFFVSFWALREFVTMTPTRRGDHRALFWVFFLFTPLQYWLVYRDNPAFELIIPVYASLFIPARIAFSGDPKRFLERSAKILAGLVICVFCLSYAPALLHLEKQLLDANHAKWNGSSSGLLFYFVLMVQLSDVAQYAWSSVPGQHVIAPSINASRTWEGLVGGIGTAALLGVTLSFATPFGLWQSACIAMIIAAMGFAGRMTMSAIKRDRGVTDTGTLVHGHAGVLDRIDSICFAAPIFYHLTRYFYT